MRAVHPLFFGLWAALTLAGCDAAAIDDAGAMLDAGVSDAAAATDAGASDAGAAIDAGASDAGTRVDASTSDAGAGLDAGPMDGGPSDGGPSDGGPSDGGPSDGGPSDAGSSDAGSSDAGALTAADVCDVLCNRLLICAGAPPTALAMCVSDCTADLLDCSESQLSTLRACESAPDACMIDPATMAPKLLGCLMTVACVEM